MWPIHNASIYKAGKDVKSFCGKKKNQLYKVYTSVKYLHRNGNMLRTKIIVRHELQVRYMELQHRLGITTCQPNVYVKIQFIQLSNLRCISARVKNLNGHLFRSSDLTNTLRLIYDMFHKWGLQIIFNFLKSVGFSVLQKAF